MATNRLFLTLIVISLLAAPFAIDWARARVRLDSISIEAQLDPPSVVADGKSTTVITVWVTENGRPRAGDLLQSWIETGSGLLIPTWTYTDEQGRAELTYTPNAYSPYEPDEGTQIHVMDTSIGRLVEVGKHFVIQVPTEKPDGKK